MKAKKIKKDMHGDIKDLNELIESVYRNSEDGILMVYGDDLDKIIVCMTLDDFITKYRGKKNG